MKTGIELMAEERHRQIEKEGWSPKHDDRHTKGSMAMAAACYACNAATMTQNEWMAQEATPTTFAKYKKFSSQGFHWPWAKKWWKPKSPIRDLVRAGALIAAEIDRINRAENLRNKQ